MDKAGELLSQLEAEATEYRKAWCEAVQHAMPPWIGFEQPDTLIVGGKRYAASLLGCFGLLGERGALLTIMSNRDDETVTFKRLHSSTGALDVLTERERQIEDEGWDARHDDRHAPGQMAQAAAAYALAGSSAGRAIGDELEPSIMARLWPSGWSREYWKPKGRRHNLVRAAALAIAEIDKLDRQAAKAAAAAQT